MFFNPFDKLRTQMERNYEALRKQTSALQLSEMGTTARMARIETRQNLQTDRLNKLEAAAKAAPAAEEKITASKILAGLDTLREPLKNPSRAPTSLIEYRAGFLYKALKAFGAKVGFKLKTPQADLVQYLLAADRLNTGIDKWSAHGNFTPPYLEFYVGQGNVEVVRIAYPAHHAAHTLDTLGYAKTKAAELKILCDHATTIIEHAIAYGLGETTKALLKSELE